MTDTLPEVEEVKRKLQDAAVHQCNNPVDADVLEEAVTLIDQLQRDNAALREGLNICKFWFAGYTDNGGKGATEELAMCQALLNPSNTGGR